MLDIKLSEIYKVEAHKSIARLASKGPYIRNGRFLSISYIAHTLLNT